MSKTTELNSYSAIFLLVFSLVIAAAASFALVAEISHLWSYSSYNISEDNTVNFQTKACLQVKAYQEGHDNLDSFSDWQITALHLRCSLLSSPDVQSAVNDFGEFINTKQHSESLNSALGTLIALITLVFAGVTWVAGSWYVETKKTISLQLKEIEDMHSDVSEKKEDVNRLIENLDLQHVRLEKSYIELMAQENEVKELYSSLFKSSKLMELKQHISDQLTLVQNEIKEHEIQLEQSETDATETSLRYRTYLELLTTSSPYNHEKAAKVLSAFYYAASGDHEFKHFSEFLMLCQQLHNENELQRYLEPSFYLQGQKA